MNPSLNRASAFALAFDPQRMIKNHLLMRHPRRLDKYHSLGPLQTAHRVPFPLSVLLRFELILIMRRLNGKSLHRLLRTRSFMALCRLVLLPFWSFWSLCWPNIEISSLEFSCSNTGTINICSKVEA